MDEALRAGAPVVALESAVLTTGMPKQALGRVPAGAVGWDARRPAALELARLLERTVRRAGAVPATVAVLDGVVRIGLDEAALERVAGPAVSGKASATDLALALACGRSAGTTVSGTLLVCGRANGAIRVLATGGIGGVHRRWTETPDVSADLRQLATTPVCVVSSGIKSFLDVPATLAALEALGVPVIAFGTDRMPLFYCTGTPELRAPLRLDTVGSVAAACAGRWRDLGIHGGVLLANPVDERFALSPAELEQAIAAAGTEARRRAVTGGALTPFLLEAVVRATGGRALDANVALLAANARLAAELSVSLAARLKPAMEPADEAG